MDVMTKVLVLTVVALVIAVTLFGEIKPLRRLTRRAARVPRAVVSTAVVSTAVISTAVVSTAVVRTTVAGTPAARQGR